MASDELDISKKLEFPAAIAVRTQIPKQGVEQPVYTELVMWNEKLPFVLIVDTPDAAFVDSLVEALVDCAKLMRANPKNREFDGTHELEAVDNRDPNTFALLDSSDEPTETTDPSDDGESE